MRCRKLEKMREEDAADKRDITSYHCKYSVSVKVDNLITLIKNT